MAPNNSNMSSNHEARDEVVEVIRALLICKKGLATLKEINSDYRSMEGENIPFKQFGFRNPEDLLRSSGKFNLSTSNGEVIVSARLSEKDEHMAKMVRETKTKKAGKPVKRIGHMQIGKSSHPSYHRQQQMQNNYNKQRPQSEMQSQAKFSRSMQNLSRPDHYQQQWNRMPMPVMPQRPIVWQQPPYPEFYQQQMPPQWMQQQGQNNWNPVPPQRMQPQPNFNMRPITFENRRPPMQMPAQRMQPQKAPLQVKPVPPMKPAPQPLLVKRTQPQNKPAPQPLPPQRKQPEPQNKPATQPLPPQRKQPEPQNKPAPQLPPQRKQPEPQPPKPQVIPATPPKAEAEKKEFAWTPLTKEAMGRHPIVQPEITFVDKKTEAKPVQEASKITVITTSGPLTRDPVTPVKREPVRTEVHMEPYKPQGLTHYKSDPNLLDLPYMVDKLRLTPKKTLASRLQGSAAKQASKSEGNSVDSGLSSSSRTTLASINFVEKMQPSTVSLSPSEDPIAQLNSFCKRHNFPQPELKMLKTGSLVACKVIIDDKTFSATASFEKEAKFQVVLEALTHLQLKEQRKHYPVIEESNHDLALLLHELLLQYPAGVMEKNLPEIFQQSTGMSLPDHWTRVIVTYSSWFTIDCGPLAKLVYAKEIEEGELLELEKEEDEEGELQLPWTEPHWGLYVTHVLSTTMVWARLIGEEYSFPWDDVMQEIYQEMEDAANRKTIGGEIPNVGSMFLVKQKEDCWFRVRCEEVDVEGKRIHGFFVDQGFTEWLPFASLHQCKEEHKKLPGQAVLFSLCGLESMEENPHAKKILEKVLLEKVVVAEIRCKEEDYVEEERIKAIFFDTTSEEDLNLVEILHDEICSAGQPPHLKPQGLNQVTISWVSDQGELFCQMPDSGLEYVQKEIEKLVTNEEQLLRYQGLKEGLTAGSEASRYLVFDRPDGKWYRATLKVRNPQSGEHLMYCLDTGCRLKVANKDIYRLGPLSRALNSYPAMVLRCQLYNIPKVEPKIISRIRALLAPNTVALVKVILIPLDGVTKVNLYLRMEPHNVIVCINDTLRMESDFESSFAV